MPSIISGDGSLTCQTPILTIQHDQYINNGKDLLLRSLHDIELLQTQVTSNDAEAAERMAEKVHIFAKVLRDEFIPAQIILPIPRVFAPVGRTSTLPQRKSKGKAKGRTLTSGEMAERTRKAKSKRPKLSDVPTIGENECIQVIRSTAP